MESRSGTPAAAEVPSLTPLRGVAALFVVAFHLHLWLPSLDYPHTAPLFLFGYLWVDFFFILSGFIISHVYGAGLDAGLAAFPYKRFLYLRWCRIYPLHAAVMVLFVVFEGVCWALHSGLGVAPWFRPFSDSHQLSGIASHLLLISSLNVHDRLMWNFGAWSISAEWVAYLAFPLLALALRRRTALISWFAFVVLVFLLNALALTNGGRLALHHHWGAVRCLLEFAIGILVYEAYRRCELTWLLRRDIPLVATMAWILYATNHFVRDIFVVPGFAALVLCAARNTGWASRVLATRPLRSLGDFSYSIYMVNVLIIEIATFAWSAAGWGRFGDGFSLGQAWATWVLALGVVVAVSYGTYHWIEVPARAWLREKDPFRGRRAAELADGAYASSRA
jgi:peptidoglycan/LPS O-acetylase OafA/YrhL